MTEPDNLGQKIHALKESLRVAWQHLGDPFLTTFERREIRNQIKQSEAELRHYLRMMSERTCLRVTPMEAHGNSLAKFNFRLLA